MEVDVESTGLIHACMWYVQEPLICQLCSFDVEWTLIDGPEVTRVLIVVVPHQSWPKNVRHSFQCHIVAAILHCTVFGVSLGARQWGIVFIVRPDAVGQDVLEVADPTARDVNALLLEPLGANIRPIVEHDRVIDPGVEEHWLVFHPFRRVLLHTLLFLACVARVGAWTRARVDDGPVDIIIKHRKNIGRHVAAAGEAADGEGVGGEIQLHRLAILLVLV